MVTVSTMSTTSRPAFAAGVCSSILQMRLRLFSTKPIRVPNARWTVHVRLVGFVVPLSAPDCFIFCMMLGERAVSSPSSSSSPDSAFFFQRRWSSAPLEFIFCMMLAERAVSSPSSSMPVSPPLAAFP